MENAALWGAAILVACYLPLYFNGAPQTGRKCNPSFGSHWIWSFVWRKIIGLPLAESRFRKEDFPDASARFIFGSHPHGVMSLHHIGTMMCPAVCEKGKAFSDLSPIESRRDLAAAILFRIPILREMVRLAGCNPERPGCNQVYPCCPRVSRRCARARSTPTERWRRGCSGRATPWACLSAASRSSCSLSRGRCAFTPRPSPLRVRVRARLRLRLRVGSLTLTLTLTVASTSPSCGGARGTSGWRCASVCRSCRATASERATSTTRARAPWRHAGDS